MMPFSNRPIAVACANPFRRLTGWSEMLFSTTNRHTFKGRKQASWSYISTSWPVLYILAMLCTERALRFSCKGETTVGRRFTAKSCECLRAFFQQYPLGLRRHLSNTTLAFGRGGIPTSCDAKRSPLGSPQGFPASRERHDLDFLSAVSPETTVPQSMHVAWHL